MRRSVSWLAVSILFGWATFARAGDKLPDQTQLADAKEDVAQALLAEAQGDNSTRAKRLTKAWLAAPDLAEANWHLARIRIADEWRPLAELVSSAANDPDQQQYRALRDSAADNPKSPPRPGPPVYQARLARPGPPALRPALGPSQGRGRAKVRSGREAQSRAGEWRVAHQGRSPVPPGRGEGHPGIARQMAATAQGTPANHRRRRFCEARQGDRGTGQARRPGDDPRPRIVPDRRPRRLSRAGGEEAGCIQARRSDRGAGAICCLGRFNDRSRYSNCSSQRTPSARVLSHSS